MARVVLMDLIAGDPVAVVEIADSFLLAVARRQEKAEIPLRPDAALTIRLERTATVTGKFFWIAAATTPQGAIELRGAFLPEPPETNPTAHAIRRALSYLVR